LLFSKERKKDNFIFFFYKKSLYTGETSILILSTLDTFQNRYYQYNHLSLNVVHFAQIIFYYFVVFQRLLYSMDLQDLVPFLMKNLIKK
jgi:hypothetical protein